MITGHLNTFRHGSRINFWRFLKQIKNSSWFLPGGKADDAPSPSLPRTRSKILRLRPWTPWIWGALGFCNNRVKWRTIRPYLVLFGARTVCFPKSMAPFRGITEIHDFYHRKHFLRG